MADYERVNAREWDSDPDESPTKDAADDGWQVVGAAKKRDKVVPTQIAAPVHIKSQQVRNAQSLPPRAKNGQPTRQQSQGAPQRKWQTSGPLRAAQSTRGPPKLLEDSDNEGAAAWRSHQLPTDSVRIPYETALDKKRYYEQIAKQYGAFIPPQSMRDAGSGRRHLEIYGEPKAVALAKEAIMSWSAEVSGGRQSAKFPKIQSLTPVLREKAEREWARQVMRQKYRQNPPSNMVFQAIGSFHWPIKEYAPEKFLGGSHEVLDPVRMSCKCYIVYHKERNMFCFMGKVDDIKKGMRRLRTACFQFAATNVHVNAERKHLLRWTIDEGIPTTVYFKEYHRPAAVIGADPVVQLPAKLPVGDGKHHDEKRSKAAEMQTGLNQDRLQSMLSKSIGKLHYYRGNLEMRVRLGTFLASRYKTPPPDGLYELKDFESMIADPTFIGLVTQEVGHNRTEQTLLSALQTTKSLVTPLEVDIAEDKLADVKPVYTATFTFADKAGDLRLSVSWQQSINTQYTNDFSEVSRRWTRLECDADAPAPIFDVSLSDLDNGAAWQFDILGSQSVNESRLSPMLTMFADNIKIDPVAAGKQSPEHVFVRNIPYAGLRSFQQSISHRYRISHSEFVLEVCRFQDRLYNTRSPSGDTATVREPRTSLSVYGTRWDTIFARNEALSVGEMAAWEDDIRTWFPDEGEVQGWTYFLEKLGKVEAFVQTVRADAEDADVAEGVPES